MVRLKADAAAIAAVSGSDFNSTMVRLKELYALKVYPPITHFNSTMVRLKVVRRFQKNKSLSMTYFL